MVRYDLTLFLCSDFWLKVTFPLQNEHAVKPCAGTNQKESFQEAEALVTITACLAFSVWYSICC